MSTRRKMRSKTKKKLAALKLKKEPWLGYTMRKEVSAMEARQKLGELLDQAYHRDDHFIVKRANKPMAAIISIHAYHPFLKQREKDFEVLDRIWAKVPNLPEDGVEAEIEAAIAEVRQEKAKARKTSGYLTT